MTRICLIPAILLTTALSAMGAGESNAQRTDRLIGVLQSDAPLFEKARACQQLGETGTAKAVPALARLLDDERLAAYARSGLEGIGGPEAADALRQALPRLGGARRIGAVHSLGVLRDARSVDALAALALDPRSGASPEALLALGRIATDPAMDVIRRALAGADAAQRVNAAPACLLAAERRLAGGDAAAAAALYDAVRNADIPPVNRIGATRGAILARKAHAVAFLVAQLHSADRIVRNEALLTARQIPSEQLARALSAELPKAPAELQVQILAALADAPDAQALEAIQQCVESDNAEVRGAALAALGKIGARGAAEMLLKVMTRTRDPADVALAASGLERMEDPAVDAMVAQSLLGATSAIARVRLIRLLEGHGVTGAIPDLLKLAGDDEPAVRVAALQALRAMAGPGELAALLGLVRGADDAAAREAAEGAVIAVCRQLPDGGAAVVLAEFQRAKDGSGRCAWIRVLASLGSATALPALTAALADADPAVAAEAARQLGRWPDLSPLEPLLAVAESSQDPAQRARALASGIQLLTAAAEKKQRPADALAALFARAARSASTAAEKRRLISALGTVPHEASLRLLQTYHADPAVRSEAAVAIVQIAPALARQDPPPGLRPLLLAIASSDASNEIRAEAEHIARTLPVATVLWASDALTKVLRSDQPPRRIDPLQASGARGETVSAQAALRSGGDIARVSCAISVLRHADGRAVIPASAIRLQWVRYIDITRNTAGLPADELVARAPASIPDPFWEDAFLAIQANQTQPLWIEIRVPADAKPGDYSGALTITGPPAAVTLPVRLRVWDFQLPPQRHLSVVNWWNFPGVGFATVQPYTDEYWNLLSRACAFLVEHRQTDINAPIGLVQESGGEQAGWKYDSSRLDRYAQTAFAAGIRRIHLHSVGRRSADLTDPASVASPVESNFRRLAEVERLIQKRQWKDRFLVSIMDEPFVYHEETFAQLVDRVHRTAPSVRCIEAVEAEHFGKLDVYVPKLSHLNLWHPRFQQVQREGSELWFYTCCHPVGRYPNRFLDQSLTKPRALFWISYLYGLDGFLHWGLNHFAGSDPYSQEGISQGLPLGDRAVVYPGRTGFLSSLRFSAQRDGLQDFEYLWLLEQELRMVKQRAGAEAFWLEPRQRPLELCRRVVQSFHEHTRDRTVLLRTRQAIAEEIEALRRGPLLVVQTSPPEGSVVPAGPRQVIVRALVDAGARVTVNGRPAGRLRPGGYFMLPYFMPDGKPTISVEVEHNGQRRAVTRTFVLTD